MADKNNQGSQDNQDKVRLDISVAADKEIGVEALRNKGAEVVAVLGGHPLADLSEVPKDEHFKKEYLSLEDEVKFLRLGVEKARLLAETARHMADEAEHLERMKKSEVRKDNVGKPQPHRPPQKHHGRPQQGQDARAQMQAGAKPVEKPKHHERHQPKLGNGIKGLDQVAIEKPAESAAPASAA